jgi:hypothetical protein
MDGPRRSGPTPTDSPGGGGRTWCPRGGYLAIALGLIAAGLAYGLMSSPTPAPIATGTATQATLPFAASSATPDPPARAAVAASPSAPAAPVRAVTAASGSAAAAAAQQVSRTRDPDGDLTPDISDFINNGERPTMAEVIDRLHQAGVYGGLGAFSPPGTRPPLVGLAVPEDFVLPEGYVRHYQATDDGQRIEPILMFSPDSPFLASTDHAKDRVVPPELAPPGLPIRRIVIPAPAEPGRPGR